MEKNCRITGKLVKTVVLDRRTSKNSDLEYGDFVFCCNCGRIMLIDIGIENCPECDEKSLMWEDENNQEVTESFFYSNSDYVLADTES